MDLGPQYQPGANASILKDLRPAISQCVVQYTFTISEIECPTHLPAGRTPHLSSGSTETDRTSLRSGGGAEPPDALDAHAMLAFLRRRKWSILFGIASVLAAVAVFTRFVTPSYESGVSFLVEAEGAADGLGGLDILDQLGRGRQIETEIELMRSRRVLNPVVDELLFRALPLDGAGPDSQRVVLTVGEELQPGSYDLVPGDPGLVLVVGPEETSLQLVSRDSREKLAVFDPDSTEVEVPQDLAVGLVDQAEWRSAALDAIASRLSIGRVQRDADLIGLKCKGPSARSARRLCSAVEESYLALRLDLERAHAATTKDLLVEQIDRVGSQLRAAENELTAYRTRNRVVALDDQASEEVRQQIDLQARRDVLEAERTALAEVLNRVESDGRIRYRELAAFPSFIGNEAVTDLMASLLELENRRSELSVTRTAQNPEVAALDQRIRSIESQIHTTARSYESALAAQVASLDQTIAGMGNRLSTLPERRIGHARLEREAESLGEVYAMLEGRMQEARIAETVNLPTVRVVDSATLPVKPSSPNLLLNLVLGSVAGLAFGLGLAFLREQLDPGIRGRRQVERETGLSVLSMIPLVDRPGPVLAFAAQDQSSSSGDGAVVRTGGGNTRRLRRAAEKAIALEAYRRLAVDLSFATRSENGDTPERGYGSLAVTSATRGEGKTLTACNLALVRAASGHRTLLIDTDIRAAGVSRFFGFGGNDPGLSDVLGDRRYDVRSVRREVAVDGGGSLTVLPAGAAVRNSASLFEGAPFEKMFRDFEREYDLIVFDTPPLTLITDAAAIVAAVEGVLVVVRSGVTEKETLEYMLQRIRRVNGNVLGVVLNGVPSRDSSYGQQYEYYRDEVKRQAGS